MLKRLLVIPLVALICASFAGGKVAPAGTYLTWCHNAGPFPPGYHKVRDISTIECSPYQKGVNNASLLQQD
jgi:hypothetical protein